MRTRVLITAYAVDPYKGSEDGTGWNISNALSASYDITVITRENNAANIEKYLSEHPNPHLRFEYFDLPYWAMWWKKKIGERGYVLYYFLWQFFIVFFIKRRNLQFDIAHCLNFHSDTHPHFLWVFGKPSFWGPIGHHTKVKAGFVYDFYGWRDAFKDLCYNLFKWLLSRLNPFFYYCLFKSQKIFVINTGISRRIAPFSHKSVILPAVAFETKDSPPDKIFNADSFNVLSIGRFTYIKGFDLAIRGYAAFLEKLPELDRERTKLAIIGKGESKEKLENLIKDLKLERNVEIISWVPYDKIKDYYNDSDVFLFASQEGAGMVIIESMVLGLPIVCLDNEGPGELAGDAALKIQVESYNKVVRNISEALIKLYEDEALRYELSAAGKERAAAVFTWTHKAKVIAAEYEKSLNHAKTSLNPKNI